jgi:rhodanese-related sulfurtransferase
MSPDGASVENVDLAHALSLPAPGLQSLPTVQIIAREAKSMTRTVDAQTLRLMLQNGEELAVLDVREEGVFSQRHILLARCLPLSRLELRVADLVPRRSTRIVLVDDGDGLAERAANRLRAFGYSDVATLAGGMAAWETAGYVAFSGINVPSKAFGEFIEHHHDTPNITAPELKRLLDEGADVVVLDSRPMDEYRRMNIPTGIDCPGAELAYRVRDAAPSPETLVVVNCAGRTRSIIGAQSLINAGVPNRVMALRNGTMGWTLAGFELEKGSGRTAPEVTPEGLAWARAAAARVAERFGVRRIDRAEFARWQSERDRRTLYVCDVRHPHEYEAGHLPGSISAPGGQLVQATDHYIGTLNSRIVLVDDTGVRATMTAHWLVQMGWTDVAVLVGGLATAPLERGPRKPTVLGLDDRAGPISVAELRGTLAVGGPIVVDVEGSRAYRAGHIPGAWFAIRARLGSAFAKLPESLELVFTSEDGVLARLAAADAIALGRAARYLDGGTAAWRAAGLALEAGETRMADEPIDAWLRPYDRAKSQEEAMNEYIAWELGLVSQIERDATAHFRLFPE